MGIINGNSFHVRPYVLSADLAGWRRALQESEVPASFKALAL